MDAVFLFWLLAYNHDFFLVTSAVFIFLRKLIEGTHFFTSLVSVSVMTGKSFSY